MSRSDFATALTARITAEQEDLRGDHDFVDPLAASVASNVDTVFDALRLGVPAERITTPTAALDYPRRLAQRGMPVTSLVRAYRLGHETMLSLLLAAIRDSDLDPRLRLAATEWITRWSFRYADTVTEVVIDEYERERAKWSEHASSARAIRVRELLASDDDDVAAGSAAIGYPLWRTHVGIVLWFEEGADEVDRLEQFLRRTARAGGAAEAPLFLAVDGVTGWGWIPVAAADATAAIRHAVTDAPDCPRVALGRPLPGIGGFRRTHASALDACRVAKISGAAVTVADDPGTALAALVFDRPHAARDWVHDVLGPLADDTPADARLRGTLEAFLRTSSSYKATAEEQNLHVSSVKYRIQRAVERRGQPIGADRLDVEVALLLRRLLP